MVSPEHGKSSSSPSDKLFVESAQWGTSESAVRLDISDGSSFFIRISRFESSRHSEGCLLDEQDIEYLREADEEFRIRKKALDLLSRREHSTFELQRKLIQRGFSGYLHNSVCAELEAEGLLDNRRFAYYYAGSRLRRKPEGRVRMEMRLKQKGVPREVCAEVLDEIYTPEATNDALASCFEGIKRKKGPLSRDEYRRELNRLGFLPAETVKFLETVSFF